MAKSMTTTKIAGGFLGALLVYLLANWAATAIYSTAPAEHGAAEGEPVRGFNVMPAEEADAGEQEAAPEMTLNDLLAAADPEKGRKLFSKCKACHKLEEGANATGPTLYGVVGRPIASVAGFGYSDALTSLEGDWTPEALDAWLADPKGYAPGNKMTFKGLPKETDRANMIAYLATVGGDGLNLEEAAAPAEEAAAPAAEEAAPATEPAATEQPAEPAATEQPAAEQPAPAAAPAAEEAAAPAPEQPAATEMAGDPEAGANVFKKCKACHAIEPGVNKVGPSLFGVVGRPVAAEEGFRYSDAMKALGGNWTPERIDQYLIKPKEYVPGTKMGFSGLRNEADRLNVIAYLESLK